MAGLTRRDLLWGGAVWLFGAAALGGCNGLDYECGRGPSCGYGHGGFDLGSDLDSFRSVPVVVSDRATQAELDAAQYMVDALGADRVYREAEMDTEWVRGQVVVGTEGYSRVQKAREHDGDGCVDPRATLSGINWSTGGSTLVLQGDPVEVEALARNFSTGLSVLRGKSVVGVDEVLCETQG